MVAIYASALLLTPASVAAASLPTTFDVTVGSRCIGDEGEPNTSFTVDWKTAGAATVAHEDVTTDENGNWNVCSSGHEVTQGDMLSASNGSGTNDYTVPGLTLEISRAGNFLNGRAPAGSIVRTHCNFGNGFEPCTWHDQVRSGPNGYWSTHVPFDVAGGDPYDARIVDDAGNRVTVNGIAPYAVVELGSATVSGAMPSASATRTLFLYDASMTLKGSAKLTGSAYDGSFSGKFRDSHGNPVTVATGDTVDASKVSKDATFPVPAITATATASNDRVTGACEQTASSAGYADVYLYRTGKLRGLARFQGDGEGGVFSFNFRRLSPFDNEANVKPGDRLVIHCVQQGGDEALLTIHAS
jgi:hypothetical protein